MERHDKDDRRGRAAALVLMLVTFGLVPLVTAPPVGAVAMKPLASAIGGDVFAFGSAPVLGSLAGKQLTAPIEAMAATPSGKGYWLVASDGGIFTFGDAGFFGSTGKVALSRPIVGMAATPSGKGYWLVASDGGIFTFGDAGFFGSTGKVALSRPIVGMAATPSGKGYWLVASDGGIFTFGDAGFFGSTGKVALSRPIVGMAATPSGKGYWLVASDGGIFTFGDAGFFGSTGKVALSRPIVGMAATPSGRGYWLVASDGGIFTFGDAIFYGSAGGRDLVEPVVGMASTGRGYWLLEGATQTSPFTPAVVASLNGIPGLVTAAVEDLNTGNVFAYHPGLALDTASSVKPEFLGTLLSEAQAAGRGLTAYEQSLAVPMIEISDNTAATTLFNYVGGAPAVQAWDRSIGLTGTTVIPNWGVSTTTATDQLKVLNTYATPNSVLNNASRAYGLSLLSHVEASQIFGVNFGIDPRALQAVKTGRLPSIGVYNAIGWVNGDGRDYLIAVYTQSVPSEPLADAAMNTVSLAAWNTLTP